MILDDEYTYTDLTNSLLKDAKVFPCKHTFELYSNPIKLLDEYLRYNVDGIEKFNLFTRTYHIKEYGIQVPMFIYEIKDEFNPYVLYVNGQPGDIHYGLKKDVYLKGCIDRKEDVLSFGVKTGETLYFMKNYVNSNGFFREEYVPNRSIITHVSDLKWIYKRFGTGLNTVIKSSDSPFNCPNDDFAKYRHYTVFVKKIGNYVCKKGLHKYLINVEYPREPEKSFQQEVDGSSLYSVYYDFMVKQNLFVDNNSKDIKYVK